MFCDYLIAYRMVEIPAGLRSKRFLQKIRFTEVDQEYLYTSPL